MTTKITDLGKELVKVENHKVTGTAKLVGRIGEWVIRTGGREWLEPGKALASEALSTGQSSDERFNAAFGV